MQSKARTVAQYIRELPADRRKVISAVRDVMRKNMPRGFEEGMQYGMIGYFVPHSLYPDGYHCDATQPLPYAHLASQKNYMSIYLIGVYSSPEERDWFCEAWTSEGKKLNMGKSCVRFKTLDDVALGVIGKAVKRTTVKKFIEHYQSITINQRRKKK